MWFPKKSSIIRGTHLNKNDKKMRLLPKKKLPKVIDDDENLDINVGIDVMFMKLNGT